MERRSGSPEVANKRRKTSWWLSDLCSLPDPVAVTILAQVSRFDRAALAMVSKRHRPLVSSHELCDLRRRETSLYVCLQLLPDPSPRWFVLTPYHRLRPIPSNPYQAPESSSFVAVDGGIYVFGGLVNGTRIRDVYFLDCYSHTWRPAPSMMMARASATAHLLDEKVYLMGGCREEDANETNWAEVFDLKTQTWHNLFLPAMCIHRSVVLECRKLVYAVDVEHRPAYVLLPGQSSRTMLWTLAAGLDSMPGEVRTDWCLINKLLYCREETSGRILWCEPGDFFWTQVKGLEELQRFFSPQRLPFRSPLHGRGLYSRPKRIQYDLCKLITNSAHNIVLFWNGHLEGSERSLELWCTEISLEIRQGCEVWGNVESSHLVFKLDPLSPLNSLKSFSSSYPPTLFPDNSTFRFSTVVHG